MILTNLFMNDPERMQLTIVKIIAWNRQKKISDILTGSRRRKIHYDKNIAAIVP